MGRPLDPKQQLILEFTGSQVRFIQAMIDLGVPKEEIFQITKMKRDAFNTAYWLVDHKNCTCIFLEEQNMTLIRRTYWTNGLITDRDLSFALEDSDLMIAEQRRRVDNGPGIDRVELISKVNAGKVSMTPTGK